MSARTRQINPLERRPEAELHRARLRRNVLQILRRLVFLDADSPVRAVEDVEPFATPSRKPNAACPVGHCIRLALKDIFASVQESLERDLTRTTLADLLQTVKASRVSKSRRGR